MRNFGWVILFAALSVLTACGGNSGASSFALQGASSSGSSTSSSSSGGAAATASIASIAVVTSSSNIPSDGSKPATITAFVRDANNNFVQGATVNFSTTSGGLAVTAATTDANGQATANLSTAGDATNRTITVTASANKHGAGINVGVTGTSISISGPANLAQGTSGTYTISLNNSSNNPIGGQVVTVSSAAGNTLSATSVTTGVTGQATVTLTAKVSGNDTITATALGTSAAQGVNVSNQSFAFTSPASNTQVNLASNATLTLNWSVSGAAQANQTVSFSTTRGTLTAGASSGTTVQGTTDGSGNVSVSIAATDAGPALVTATAANVTTQIQINFIATDPSAIDLQASPADIQTQGQSTITAILRDPANNLVANQTIVFQLTDVTNGQLSVGTAVTDLQGRAQTVYTASTTSSATNGVTITATVLNNNAVPAATAHLTVGGNTVFLSLGTGELIRENTDKTQFILPYIVQAQDASGNAVNGVNITLAIKSLSYGKGGYVIFNSSWVQTSTPGVGNNPASAPPPITVCANEDVLGTGIYSAGEDTNHNGKLDPGNIAAVSPGTVSTGPLTYTDGSSSITVNGAAALNVTYPEDHALWVYSELTATATVSGTETSTTSSFWLPILSTYITSTQSTPPGVVSPYGIATSCANPN